MLLEALIRSLSFRKSMRWGDGEFRFARPVRWLVALYGDEVIPLTFEGLEAGRAAAATVSSPRGEVEINGPGDYLDKLRRLFRPGGRGATPPGASCPASRRPYPPGDCGRCRRTDTLDEVVDLVEYPHVIVGGFEERFLELPREVLETAMQEHQRYFPLEDAQGDLAAAFLVVHNGDPGQEEIINRGNERVLRARLEDASFFYREDLSMSLEERLEDLKSGGLAGPARHHVR